MPAENPEVDFPLWQRWNDYGKSGRSQRAELRQATEAFTEVEKLRR